jgi:tRNA pseudouridine38/39 synthase
MSCQAENDNSVEEYIFKVMHTVSLIPRSFPPDPSFTRAGRTDKGVSAMGNVIALKLRSESNPNKTKVQYCKMMNALLP